MNDVIRQYHYFQVQTIDSFMNILLVGCSFKIGLSARFKIQRNSKEYLQLSLDELLDQAHQRYEDTPVFRGFCAPVFIPGKPFGMVSQGGFVKSHQ